MASRTPLEIEDIAVAAFVVVGMLAFVAIIGTVFALIQGAQEALTFLSGWSK